MPPTHVPSSTPYPWPWDGDLSGSATALAVVVPREFTSTKRGDNVAAVHHLAGLVHAAGGLVVLVTTKPPGRAGLRPPPGSQRSALLDEALADQVVHADGIDGFCGSRLESLLRAAGVRRLILAGAGLETCVHSTMRSANDRGYECLLVIDATVAYEPELVPAAVSMIEMSGGIFGAVARTDDVTTAFSNFRGD